MPVVVGHQNPPYQPPQGPPTNFQPGNPVYSPPTGPTGYGAHPTHPVGGGGIGHGVYNPGYGPPGGGGVPLGTSGTPGVATSGASAGWRADREALIREKRKAMGPDQPGFRTDAEGNRYWYQPGIDAAAANNPVNKAWAYGLANPTGAFALRQFAGQGPAPVRAYLAPPPATPPPPGPGGSPGLHSVVDTPSTHGPRVPGPVQTIPAPAGGGAIPASPAQPAVMASRYFPLGQTTPGYGGAPLGAGAGPGGGKPAGASGFDPATAPTSAAAKQQGAAFQQRQSTAQHGAQVDANYGAEKRPYNQRYTAANPYQPTSRF